MRDAPIQRMRETHSMIIREKKSIRDTVSHELEPGFRCISSSSLFNPVSGDMLVICALLLLLLLLQLLL
jgi:hypothetical protein